MTDRYAGILALDRDPPPLLFYWIRIKSHKETVALYRLEDQGYEPYFPRCLTPQGRVEPLFPWYLALGARQPVWRSILATRGVIDALTGASDEPQAFPADVIDAIRAREEGGYIRLKGPRPRAFQHGERVKVTGDQFAGHTAVFDELDPKKRVAWLQIYLFGAERRVSVPVEHVAAT